MDEATRQGYEQAKAEGRLCRVGPDGSRSGGPHPLELPEGGHVEWWASGLWELIEARLEAVEDADTQAAILSRLHERIGGQLDWREGGA